MGIRRIRNRRRFSPHAAESPDPLLTLEQMSDRLQKKTTSVAIQPGDAHWMGLALQEAGSAAREGEVPVGAVAVFDGRLVAREHNRSIQLNDPSAHAEILILRKAGAVVGNYRLLDVEVFVTVEPCAMCAGALIWARVRRLVFGARDSKAGAVVSRFQLLEPGLSNHTVTYEEGLRATECRKMMQDFFAARR